MTALYDALRAGMVAESGDILADTYSDMMLAWTTPGCATREQAERDAQRDSEIEAAEGNVSSIR